MNESSVAKWLNELRYSIESYENASRPVSCADLAVILKKRCSQFAEIRTSRADVAAETCDDDDDVYEKIWECRSKNDPQMDVKHAEICRVSTVFQECAEEEDFAKPAVVVDNYEVFVAKNVLNWLSDLLCSSEDEDECDFEEFKRHLEKNSPAPPPPSRFPVLDEDVQIRSERFNFQTCRQTIHDFQGSSRTTVSATPVVYDIIVKGPLKLRDGGPYKYEKGSITLKMDQSSVIIEDNSKRKVIAKNLKIKSRTATIIELVDGTSTSDKVLYRIQVEHESQIEDHQRRRSNSLNEKQETKRIQNILKNLIKRRSDRYLLEKKGIIKNEPIFGNTLSSIYQNSKETKDPVPHFVREIIKLIEMPKNIKSEHIYRISGNLATIQKIRLNLDRNKLDILKDFVSETDVLTGTLKLFFRELREPLIPRDKFTELHKLLHIEDESKRDKSLKNVVNGIETPHKETLLALLEHLNKVIEHSEENKMTAQSLSIVWGPSLYWDDQPPNQIMMAFSLDVNKVVELLLNAYKHENTNDRFENKLLAIGEENEDEEEKHSPGVIRRFFSPKRLASREFHGSNASLNDKKDSEAVSLRSLPKKPNTHVPEIVWRITEQIEKNLDTKDLYGRAENKDKSNKFKKKLVRGKLEVSKIATHDLASYFMAFLKDLNESLIPVEMFNYFLLDTTKKYTENKLETLNDEHRETLEHVLTHVLKVIDRKEINNMSKDRMIPIWAKTLYASRDNSDYQKCVQLVETLLEIYDDRRKHSKFAHNVNIKSHHRPIVKNQKMWKGFAEDAVKQNNERTVRQSTYDNLEVSRKSSPKGDHRVVRQSGVQTNEKSMKYREIWRRAAFKVMEQRGRRSTHDNLDELGPKSKMQNVVCGAIGESKICDSFVENGKKVSEDGERGRNVDKRRTINDVRTKTT